MKKTQKKTKKKPTKKPTKKAIEREIASAGPLDWTPLFRAFREAFEWALDVAVGLARDYPEEVAAVERVRAFMRARIAGQPANVCTDDILFTFALIIGAIERDLGASSEWMYPEPLRFPGSTELWEPWLPTLIYTLNRSGNRTRATA